MALDNQVSVPMPYPNTEHSLNFTAVGGTYFTSETSPAVMGCYRLSSLKSNDFYVGQSVHLGYRVRFHAKQRDKTTKEFVASQGNDLKATLYYLPNSL